jgi:hypothetical protein
MDSPDNFDPILSKNGAKVEYLTIHLLFVKGNLIPVRLWLLNQTMNDQKHSVYLTFKDTTHHF